MSKEILLFQLEKIHTTEMGMQRIQRNLQLTTNDAVTYCKKMILDEKCNIYKRGKNWYCQTENILITINASTYTIITAHILPSSTILESSYSKNN